jgi:hypothetical protein
MDWFNLGGIDLNNPPEGDGFMPLDVPDDAAQTHEHEAADPGFMSVDDGGESAEDKATAGPLTSNGYVD